MRKYTTKQIGNRWHVVRRCKDRADAIQTARTLNGDQGDGDQATTGPNTERLAAAEAQAAKSRP